MKSSKINDSLSSQIKSEKSEEDQDSHEFPQTKSIEKYEERLKKPNISNNHKKHEKKQNAIEIPTEFPQKYLSFKKESKENEKISSKGRKITLRSKEFPQAKKDLSIRSSSEESERNSIRKNQGKRKREEYSDSSLESNHGYKKKVLERSDSESKEFSLSNISSGPKEPSSKKMKEKGKKTKIIGKEQEKTMKKFTGKEQEKPIGKEQEKTIKRFTGIELEKPMKFIGKEQEKPMKFIGKEQEKPMKFIGKEQEKTINKFIGIVPKEKGNFIYGDKAKKIVNAKTEGDEILCQIQWMERPDGTVPKISYLTNTIIKEYDPLILANFYETKVLKIKTQRKIKEKIFEIQFIFYFLKLKKKNQKKMKKKCQRKKNLNK